MPFSGEEPFLRGLFADDDANVLAAFSSNPDMARQGKVTSLEEARAYVDGLISSGEGSALGPSPILAPGVRSLASYA